MRCTANSLNEHEKSGVSAPDAVDPSAKRVAASNLDFPHRLLASPFQLAIERDVLVHRQRFPAGMRGDQLKLGVGEGAVAGEPGDRLVAERVGRGTDASLHGITLTILLRPPGAVPDWDEPQRVSVGS